MEWMSEEWREMSLNRFLSYVASTGIIFGGVLPYIPQYRQINRTQNADGFSTYVCFALLIANTLRIMFWFGHEFEAPLLIQSFVMNLAMIAIIELCVRVRNKDLLIPNKNRLFIDDMKGPNNCMFSINKMGFVYYINLNSSDGNTANLQPKRFYDFDWRYFWQWTDFISYIECLATFTVFSGIFMYVFIDVPVLVETVGFLAVFIEALLGAPQLLKNYKNKSTVGMSEMMVFMWTVGDLFKTSYFIVRSAPLQFWVCGVLQVSIDLFIFGQTLAYRTPYNKKLSKAYDH